MPTIDTCYNAGLCRPSVETDLFAQNTTARFAVGVIAVGDHVLPGRGADFVAYLRLRAAVYADMIAQRVVTAVGTESDDDDARSAHFAIIENAPAEMRVVATFRLIVKLAEDPRPLPVERFFPEAFSKSAPLRSTEMSRLICTHADRHIQQQFKWSLLTAAMSYALRHGLAPAYGVVERSLERSLAEGGVPVRRLAPPRYIGEYSTENLAIEVDYETLARNMGLARAAMDLPPNGAAFAFFGDRAQ